MLASTYQPQNSYCYSVDEKSDTLFRARMFQLEKCFSNVIISNKYRNVTSAGRNMVRSQLDCINLLAKNKRKWKYVILLQVTSNDCNCNLYIVSNTTFLSGAIMRQSKYLNG